MSSIFDQVREHVRMRDAISFLGLKFVKQTNPTQLRYACPNCKGKDPDPLSINVADDLFKCFAKQPHAKGTDATALVAHVKGCTQTEAAKMLHEHFISAARARNSPKPAPQKEESKALVPLDYLEAEHPVLDLLEITPASCRALGAGFAPRGTMAGRILIPLRLPSGKLVGYLGIATKADQAPFLLLPKNLEAMCLEGEPVEESEDEQPAPDELRKLFRVV